MQPTLRLIRGLPGSGKSTLAASLPNYFHFEADQYFTWGGVYHFNPNCLGFAHAWCFRKVQWLMMTAKGDIAVANTFTRKWEYARYVTLAEQMGYEVKEYICTDSFPNIHGVPSEKVEQMRARFEY